MAHLWPPMTLPLSLLIALTTRSNGVDWDVSLLHVVYPRAFQLLGLLHLQSQFQGEDLKSCQESTRPRPTFESSQKRPSCITFASKHPDFGTCVKNRNEFATQNLIKFLNLTRLEINTSILEHWNHNTLNHQINLICFRTIQKKF